MSRVRELGLILGTAFVRAAWTIFLTSIVVGLAGYLNVGPVPSSVHWYALGAGGLVVAGVVFHAGRQSADVIRFPRRTLSGETR